MQKNPIAALIALSVSLFLAGCEEPTGEADVQGLDEAAEDAAEGTEDAADETEEAVEEAGEEVEEATEDEN